MCGPATGLVMFRGELAIQMNIEVVDDSRRLDLARANLDIGVHVFQFNHVSHGTIGTFQFMIF